MFIFIFGAHKLCDKLQTKSLFASYSGNSSHDYRFLTFTLYRVMHQHVWRRRDSYWLR